MTGWIILSAVGGPAAAVLGWLLSRVVRQNDAAHEQMGKDIAQLKDGQSVIKTKLDMLLDGFRKEQP